jgi:hypothetical protein
MLCGPRWSRVDVEVVGVWELLLSVALSVLPTCASEDASGVCAWDASVQGNGQGSSFVVVGDRVFFVEG